MKLTIDRIVVDARGAINSFYPEVLDGMLKPLLSGLHLFTV